MSGDLNYYSILEIPKNATEAVVRRAYRRLALKWHPDKNPDSKEEADRRFKEISEAYEILSDTEKRRIYDTEGKAGLARHLNRSSTSTHSTRNDVDPTDPFTKMPHFHFAFRDPAEVFREFFGAWNPFEDLFRHHVHLHHHHHNLHHRTPYDKEPFNPRRRHFVISTAHPGVQQHRVPQPRPATQIPTQKAAAPQQTLRPTVTATTVPAAPGLLFSNIISNSLMARNPFSPFHRAPITQIPTLRTGSPVIQGRFSSTSTRFRDGHQIVTRTVIENGRETVTIEQDGIVISMTVNGNSVPVANR